MALEELFVFLLNNSITAGWVILAVVALRFVLKRAPQRLVSLLWVLPALRLVFPFSLPSKLSIVPSVETVPQEILTAPVPAIGSNIPVLDNAVNPVLEVSFTPDPGASANPMQIIMYLAGLLYLVGLALILILSLVKTIRLHCRLREAVLLRDNIFESDSAETPFVMGILRPRIYLPFSLDPSALDYVLAHERAHIDRRDNLSKLVGFLILAVYWFSPLVWLAYALFCRDIERACDERVISAYDAPARKAYSLALLGCSVQSRSVLFCPVAFGELGVKSRIKSVLDFKKPAVWVSAAVLLVCAVAAVCLLTAPEKDAGEPAALYSADELSPDCQYQAENIRPFYAASYAGAVSLFSSAELKESIRSYPLDSPYYVADYKLIDHRLLDIEPGGASVVGEVSFALIGCADESVWLAEGAVRRNGYNEGQLMLTRRFVLFRDAADYFHLTAYGNGDYDVDTQLFPLPEDFHSYISYKERLAAYLPIAQEQLDLWYELGILAHPIPLDGDTIKAIGVPAAEDDGDIHSHPEGVRVDSYWSPTGYAAYVTLDVHTNKIISLDITKIHDEDDVPIDPEPHNWGGEDFYMYDNLDDIVPADLTLNELCKLLADYWGYSGYTLGANNRPVPTDYSPHLWETFTPTGSETLRELLDNDYIRVYFEGDESENPMYITPKLMLAYTYFCVGYYHPVG